jgi:hypothetical protein
VIIDNCTIINQQIVITSCFDIQILDLSYSDRYIGVTNAVDLYPVNIQTKVTDVLVDGMIFGARGVPLNRVHPYQAPVAIASNERIRVRNIGSLGSPATTATVGVNTPARMIQVSGVNIDIKLQNIHMGMIRTGIHAFLNVDKNITIEKCSIGQTNGGLALGGWLTAALNAKTRGGRSEGSAVNVGANASVYGTHFEDIFQTDTQGYVKLGLNEPTAETNALVTQNGTPKFTSVPSLVMSDSDDEVIVEMDYYAQGHTGFLGASDRTLLPVWTGQAAISASMSYTWAANVVTVTQGAHGYKTGDWLWIAPTSGGLSGAVTTYNKPYQITVTSSSTFTFAQTGSGASGSLTALYVMNVEYQIDKNVGTGYNGTWKNLVRPKYAPQITNASAVVTMNSTTGLAVNDYVWSSTIADFPSGTRIQSIDSATQITLTANAAATSTARVLYFSQLPNESIVAADGFKMKWRFTAATPHSRLSLTYVHVFTSSTLVAQQAISYPLDTFNLTLTGLKNPTEVRVFDAGTTVEIGGSENITSGSVTIPIDAGTYPTVDISVLALGYQNFRLTDIDMTTGDLSIPIQQIIDRQYLNA